MELNRKGRVLILEDLEKWQLAISGVLRKSGFETYVAGTISDALKLLETEFYHIGVLDIRLDQNSEDNKEGMELLRQLVSRDLGTAMKFIVLSGVIYDFPNDVREVFTKLNVYDCIPKIEFRDGTSFLRQIQKAFAEIVNIDLKIHWQAGIADPKDVVVDFWVGGNRVRRNTNLQERLGRELDDLLCRLFHRAKEITVLKILASGKSGAGVLLVLPQYENGIGQRVIVKCGDFQDIDKEHRNFENYVKGRLGDHRYTNVEGLKRTPYLGGIVYSLLGNAHASLTSFGDFFLKAEIAEIQKVLTNLFQETCRLWYANPGQLQFFNLKDEYARLNLTEEELERARNTIGTLPGSQQLTSKSLKEARKFTNPTPYVNDPSLFVELTYFCVTHGDLNANNIFVDSSHYAWLIDFGTTGPGHILRDIAELDAAVRIQLLSHTEASLEERLKMEETLLKASFFSEIDQLATAFETDNAALKKVFLTVIHLRKLAYKKVEQKPDDSMREYYIALYFYSLKIMKFNLPTTQREHALLSASLLIDHLRPK